MPQITIIICIFQSPKIIIEIADVRAIIIINCKRGVPIGCETRLTDIHGIHGVHTPLISIKICIFYVEVGKIAITNMETSIIINCHR